MKREVPQTELDKAAAEISAMLGQLVTKRYRNFTVRVEARGKRKAGDCSLDGEIVLYKKAHDDGESYLATALHELAHHVAITRWRNQQLKRYGNFYPWHNRPYHGVRWRRALAWICSKFNDRIPLELDGGSMIVFSRKAPEEYGHHDCNPMFVRKDR
jgi:hypothetical protein